MSKTFPLPPAKVQAFADTNGIPPTPARVSVPITPEVHAAFQRLAKASNSSTGRVIAEWLADTVEAAEFMATKMEQARAAPRVVMQEMHAYALGLADETQAMLNKVREKGARDRGVSESLARAPGPSAVAPPSSNTGGKVPQENPKPRGRKS